MEVEDAGGAPTMAASASKLSSTRRFRNWKLIAIELAIVILGLYVLNATTVRKPVVPGIVGVLVAVVALWMVMRELAGILIKSEAISMPTNRIQWFPVLSFSRRTVSLSEVRRLTVSPPWSGFEVVRISGDFGSEVLVFFSKGQRRRFIAMVESLCPGVAVYRSRSLPG